VRLRQAAPGERVITQAARCATSKGKTMTQTVSKSPTDVIEFLVNQHGQIKSLFAETLKASGEAREEPFTALRRLLAVHETAEEEIVHPRAKHELANGDETVSKRLEEENEAKKVLAGLEKMDAEIARSRELAR
jgi:hemerythrin superfamily protein